jgi:hypothetical protein
MKRAAAAQAQMTAQLMVAVERARQDHIHAGHTCADVVPTGMKLAILMEEVGEVAEAIQDRSREQLLAELTQVAAVAQAWMESLLT